MVSEGTRVDKVVSCPPSCLGTTSYPQIRKRTKTIKNSAVVGGGSSGVRRNKSEQRAFTFAFVSEKCKIDSQEIEHGRRQPNITLFVVGTSYFLLSALSWEGGVGH